MYRITIQHVVKTHVPKAALLRKWAKAALSGNITAAELTLRIVGIEEMSLLNFNYRHKSGPTNVLSFAFEMPEGVELTTPILGDIVICAEVVEKEAEAQKKSWEAHWAHMVVHGVYHLLGFDHVKDEDAEEMEALEIKTMEALGYSNPYEAGEHIKDYG